MRNLLAKKQVWSVGSRVIVVHVSRFVCCLQNLEIQHYVESRNPEVCKLFRSRCLEVEELWLSIYPELRVADEVSVSKIM